MVWYEHLISEHALTRLYTDREQTLLNALQCSTQSLKCRNLCSRTPLSFPVLLSNLRILVTVEYLEDLQVSWYHGLDSALIAIHCPALLKSPVS